MTFLNPFFLFGLAAASLPVLFHLFARRKSRRVEFSSLRFLQKLEKTSMLAVKIRQILLLIVRTLLIAALVLAFARPALKGYLGSFFGSSHANTSMVFLVDNSASMSRSDDHGELLKQAKDAGAAIAAVLEDGDDATVIPLASISRDETYHPMHSRAEVLGAISGVHLADRPAVLSDGLRLASSILSQSHNVNKEVYLFSDDQARNLRDAEAGMTMVGDRPMTDSNHAAKLFDASTKVFTMRLGNGEHIIGRNLSLDSLRPITTIFEPGRPIQFEVWVRNTTSESAENVVLSLFYNGERVAQKTIAAIGGGESQHVTIDGPARGSGIIRVRAELEPDALPFDNARFAIITVPISRRIGIFVDDPANAEFIKLALEQTLSQAQTTAPFIIELKPVSELRSLSSNAGHYDGIMVGVGPGKLDPTDLIGLKQYVASGYGAALFLLPGIDISSVNAELAKLALPQITRKEGMPNDAAHYLSFASLEFRDPFFSGMFETSPANGSQLQSTSSPKIFESYDLATNAGLPLIKLSNGSPFLVESKIDKGDILFYGIPPTLAFSDFPRKPIFLPLIRRTGAFVSSVHAALDENQPKAFVTTEPFDVRLPALAGLQSGATVLVQEPDASSTRARVTMSPDGMPELRMEEARVAGNYTVFRDAEAQDPIAAFAVNIQSDESDLRASPESEVRQYFAVRMSNLKPAIIALQPADRQLVKTVEQSRYGVELWQSFLLAAIVLAIIELILAREGRNTMKPETALATN